MIRRLAASAFALLASPALAGAAGLAPHRAVYELSLVEPTAEVLDAEGRIAMELTTERCGFYGLDYRFVAQFAQEQELIVTDQQTISTESASGDSFDFSTRTFVDGVSEKEISGEATSSGDKTVVAMTEPEERRFELPLSLFPMQHTATLIEKAKAGERIVETRLFDGDEDAEKLLSSTAIIAPLKGRKRATAAGGEEAAGEDGKAGTDPSIADRLSELDAWRIIEAYYNSDSDPDGLPIYQTSYTLYENGVSDDLMLDFGTYALEGSLSSLDLLASPECS